MEASATPIHPAAALETATAAVPIVPAFRATRALRERGIPELLMPDRGPPPCRQGRTLTTPVPHREGNPLNCSTVSVCPIRQRRVTALAGLVTLVAALAGCGGGSGGGKSSANPNTLLAAG